MIYNVSSKGFYLSDETVKYVGKHVKKVSEFVPFFGVDTTQIEIIIRKHKKRNLNHMDKNLDTTNESVHITTFPKKTSYSVYYDGTILFRLPIKPLIVRLFGTTPDETIGDGFKHLLKELETYGGLHIKSGSKYFDHSTIRDPSSLRKKIKH